MDVIVTGASGLIGSALRPALATAGHRMIALVRRPARSADEVEWDPRTGRLDRASIEGAGAAVHLAGVGIGDKRWSAEQKRALRDSRVQGTGLLARAIAELNRPPGVLVSASAVGYYGDRGDETLDELSPPGEGFLPDLCVAWETATGPAEHVGTRVARMRTGIVLSKEGGALRKQLPLFKIGLGGRFGSGRQWQSWITIDDVVRAISHLFTTDVTGPVNFTAPNPVMNAEFTKTLGKVLGRPAVLPIPKLGPSLVLGRELADNLLYSSQRVVPKQLEASGFEFAHPELEGALRHVLDKPVAE
jgi:uncharacterized protein (TIGR01777 family)